MSAPWADAALVDHLHEIDELLQRHTHFWQPQAFTFLQMPWEANYPLLAKNLRALSLEQADLLAANETALANFLHDFIPDAQAILRATMVPTFASQSNRLLKRAMCRAANGSRSPHLPQRCRALCSRRSNGVPVKRISAACWRANTNAR